VFDRHRFHPESIIMQDQATGVSRSSQAAPACVAVADLCAPENDSVAEAAQQRLRASAYFGVRTVSCEHHEGVLVLRGRVLSYYHKQLAQESVRHIPGVEVIINVVDVLSPNLSELRSST